MGLNNLADIFKEEYYQCLDGGILEAFGVLFKDNVKIYAYPIDHENFERYRKQIGRGDNVEAEINEDGLVTVENLMVAQNLRNLYKYVRENGFLEDLNNCNRTHMRSSPVTLFFKGCGTEAKIGRNAYPNALPT